PGRRRLKGFDETPVLVDEMRRARVRREGAREKRPRVAAIVTDPPGNPGHEGGEGAPPFGVEDDRRIIAAAPHAVERARERPEPPGRLARRRVPERIGGVEL